MAASPNKLRSLIWHSTAIAAVFAISGCGPKSDRLEVTGTITLNGAPLDSGSIRFSSSEGQKLVATGAIIKDGAYQVPQAKGLPPGKYRVEINSPDLKAPPIMLRSGPGAAGIPTAPERIPAEYNVNSQQSIDVTVDGDNRFDFAIVAKAS
jgi:hypothetical protein